MPVKKNHIDISNLKVLTILLSVNTYMFNMIQDQNSLQLLDFFQYQPDILPPEGLFDLALAGL